MNQNRQMAVAPLNTKIETVEAVGTSTITSRQLAELSGKKHKHILESIRDMEPAWVKDLGQPKFRPTSYIDSWNRPQLEYLLTESEALYIASKWDDVLRGKLILKFEELHNERRQMMKAMETERNLRIVNILAENTTMFSKADVMTMYVNAGIPRNLLPASFTTDDTLKSLTDCLRIWGVKMSAKAFNTLLMGNNMQFKSNGKWFVTDKGKGYGKQGKYLSEDGNTHDTGIRWDYTKFGEVLDICEVEHNALPDYNLY